MLNTIDENVKFDNDWYRIKAHFEKIHPGFFDRLRQKYPQLTPTDHKLLRPAKDEPQYERDLSHPEDHGTQHGDLQDPPEKETKP
ncbi:MAG: hypothetical protein MZV63_06400 [Marinilabiliales bacterium]|nr:hypothetical protein [Marinilabiliales bacterium]